MVYPLEYICMVYPSIYHTYTIHMEHIYICMVYTIHIPYIYQKLGFHMYGTVTGFRSSGNQSSANPDTIIRYYFFKPLLYALKTIISYIFLLFHFFFYIIRTIISYYFKITIWTIISIISFLLFHLFFS